MTIPMRLRMLLSIPLLAGAVLAGSREVHAQDTENPAGRERGFTLFESFEGSANSEGLVSILSTSASYNFNQHFSAGIGLPIYFDHTSSSNGGTSSDGIGNFFATVRGVWRGPVVNYGTSLTGSAPTGSSSKGLSTGHATFDWDNRVEHRFDPFTPYLDAGLANSITDTRFFLRPFISYGDLLHSEAGSDVDLSHSVSLTVSAYDILPFGTQTIISRFVNTGVAGTGGQHGRAFEISHSATGTSDLTRDNGFTAGLSFSPKPYLELEGGYTRGLHFALNTVSFGLGFNISSFFSRNSQSSSR